MNHIREIEGHDVVCQSCWVDGDGDIQANVGISNGKTGMSRRITYFHVQLSPMNKVSYPGRVSYVGDDRLKLTVEEYDRFWQIHYQSIAGLIEDLLDPDEVNRLGQRPRQMMLL